MLAHQGHVVEVMVFDDSLIAACDLLRRGQQPNMAMFQNVLFVIRNFAAFVFTHAASLKKSRRNVPQKVLTSLFAMRASGETTRPTARPVDPQAFDYYLKGKFSYGELSESGIQ